jgi:hypothetical protein
VRIRCRCTDVVQTCRRRSDGVGYVADVTDVEVMNLVDYKSVNSCAC